MPEDRVVAIPQEIPDSDADCIAHIQQVACWKNWCLFDLAMLRGCVKLLVLALPGWRESQGVIMETAAAKALDIPVEVLTVEAGLPCDLERQLTGTA